MEKTTELAQLQELLVKSIISLETSVIAEDLVEFGSDEYLTQIKTTHDISQDIKLIQFKINSVQVNEDYLSKLNKAKK